MLTSLVRTYVPLAVSWLAGFLLTLGVEVTDDQKAALSSLFGAVVAALYYLGARLLEKKFPWATVLLGSAKQPAAYSPDGSLTTPPVEEVAPAEAGKHEA